MSVIDKLTGNDDVESIEFSEVGFAILKERLHASVQRANLAIIIIAVSALTILGAAKWAVSTSEAAAERAEAAAEATSEKTLSDVEKKLDGILESRKKSTGKFDRLHQKAEERDRELKDDIEKDMGRLEEQMKKNNETNRMILEHLLEMEKRM